MGRFSKKNAKMLTKFPGLATSGRHNSAVITFAENSLPNGPPVTVRINSKSFPWAVRCAQEANLKLFRDFRNYVWYR